MMSNRKWLAAAALMAMSSGALADGTYEFDSITNLQHNQGSITGVLVNDTAPTTLTLSPNGTGAQCFSWLELMMTQPGQFTLTVVVTTTPGPFQNTINLSSCALNAKP